MVAGYSGIQQSWLFKLCWYNLWEMKLSTPKRTHSEMREAVLAALFLNGAETVALVMYDLKLSQSALVY